MPLFDGVLQPPATDVRVDLGRREIGVPEHGLNRAEIGTALEQIGRERMPQDMRRDPVSRQSRSANRPNLNNLLFSSASLNPKRAKRLTSTA